MVRPADESRTVARMVELRAVEARVSALRQHRARGRSAVFARAAGEPRRAGPSGAADGARARGSATRSSSASRPSPSAAWSRASPGAGIGGIQPRPARAHRLRRPARRPACSGSAAARRARCWSRCRRIASTRWSRRCAPICADEFVNVRSYRSNEDEIGRDFDRAENYLSLVGLVIVILGGIAVSSVTRVFILQKIRSIAVLKCLGARSRQIIASTSCRCWRSAWPAACSACCWRASPSPPFRSRWARFVVAPGARSNTA